MHSTNMELVQLNLLPTISTSPFRLYYTISIIEIFPPWSRFIRKEERVKDTHEMMVINPI